MSSSVARSIAVEAVMQTNSSTMPIHAAILSDLVSGSTSRSGPEARVRSERIAVLTAASSVDGRSLSGRYSLSEDGSASRESSHWSSSDIRAS